MKIFSIELKITFLILVIVASIIALGYLSYKNLSQIVLSIHKEARPDYKLIKIKEITSDLTEVDNSVQLYSLTREPKYLKPYNRIISSIDKRIEELLTLQGNDTSQLRNIHAVGALIGEKLVVWDQILKLHSKPLEKEVFEEFYSVIEKRTTDSVAPKKNNILKRFFKRKKEPTLGKEEVQQEVAKLERSLSDKTIQQAESESQLLKKNNQLGAQLQFLILQLEQKETESLFIKSLEAEILAGQTYQWLAIFCLAAVALLIVVLFIIIKYSRKSSQSQLVLRRAKTEADNLIKAKELFTANVSHELRTPMNAIYGLSEQLLQQPMDEKIRSQLTVIKKSADYLNKIVNDILDFSKIEAGKLVLETIPFNPRTVFEEVCALNQVIADQKNLNFDCKFSSDLPKQVKGDPTRLRQILLNLLSNAFKFTDNGSVSVHVNVISKPGSVVSISIMVSDSGIGIAPEKVNAIFDDYTQAGQDTNRRYGGTGLGLSIVKKITELMNGTIDVTSKVNEGTTFVCKIPFPVSEELLLPEEAEVLTVPKYVQKLNILIADDEEYNRMLLSTIFNRWNVRFKSVVNGKDAVRLSGENHFDVILMDLRMPEMDGYDATREILGKSPQIQIIALTAGNFSDDIKKCRECGMVGFLMKPFSEMALLQTIVQSLEKKTITMQPIPDSVYEVNSPETDEIKLEELYRVSGGDEHFVDEMLNLFIKTSHDGIKNLRLYLREQNWRALSDTAHKMAPPCRHLGALSLYKNLKELEKTEEGNVDFTRINQLVEIIESRVIELTSEIEQKIA
jgi:signal transduction histidine kinase/CheY-like chemotaxis protein/HPt (histidine-containing phosphotransfer) domain-containing protein